MARFPHNEVERVKRDTDLAALVRSAGVELQPQGEDLLGLCPFHDDHLPSLVVSPSKGLWHCLGACRAGGTAIDWLMRRENLSFRAAVARLQSPAIPHHVVARASVDPSSASADRPSNPDLLARVLAVYRESYRLSTQALAYATKRGIGSQAAAENFGYGFADRSLVEKIGQEHLSELIRLGVVHTRTHRDHLDGCLVLPIIGDDGSVLNLYGRKLVDQAGSPRHLYLPGSRRGVFNCEALVAAKELILCEAIIDALTFWCHGFHSVTCAYGVNGFTDDLLRAITAAGIERVLIAYDRDAAGDAAAREVAKKLSALRIGCWRVLFPKGMDANAYALHLAPAEKSLSLALASAQWLAGPKQRPTTTTHDDAPSASVMPPAEASPIHDAPADTPAAVDPFDLVLGERRWRVRGLAKNLSYEKLSLLVRVECSDRVFVDTVDLVSAKQRKNFVHQAAVELGLDEEIVRKDLAKLHLALEPLQDQRIRCELSPKTKTPAVAPEAEREALAFLKRPDLIEAILTDFDRCGIVGERVNKLVGYLAAVSRKLDRPLAVVVQSSSAAGKSALIEAILALVPEEERVSYSAMTGQSLFYMGETDLQHKVLAIAEEEGAERAAYALKLLQSEGELTIASTGKDPQSGKLITHEYRVEGPVAILLTTTAIDVDEELLNRCLVLTVDEDREQTRAIHARQREGETLEGLLAERERQRIVVRHRNAQRLLKPVLVVNPYARQLTFLDDRTRTRRDHVKYLTLIRAIALLYQHQRPRKTTIDGGERVEYIEVELQDIALANQLAHEVLGRSLDELPPQTRLLLDRLNAWVGAECGRHAIDRADFLFSRRQVREAIGWSDFQVKTHLTRLEELEYVLAHKGSRGQSFVYELVYDGKAREHDRFLPGLLDLEGCDPNLEGSGQKLEGVNGNLEGPRRAQSAPLEPPRRGTQNATKSKQHAALLANTPHNGGKTLLGKHSFAAAAGD